MSNKVIKNKHDEIFRKSMENSLVAQEFFERHLPERIKSICDMTTLEIQKETFIDEELSKTSSDVLFAVDLMLPAKDGTQQEHRERGYLYLLVEAQSRVDKMMALRTLKYMISIVEMHHNSNPQVKKLPLVFPMVFYNGKEPYTAALDVWALFSEPNLAKEFWTGEYMLIDIGQMSDEQIKSRPWVGIIEFFMKHIYERDQLKNWEAVGKLLSQVIDIHQDLGHNYIVTMLHYTLTNVQKEDKIKIQEFLNNHLNPELGGKVMTTLAQSWIDEGINKGIALGKTEGIALGIDKGIALGKTEGIALGKSEGKTERSIEIAKVLLTQGTDLNIVSKATDLSIDELKRLKD